MVIFYVCLTFVVILLLLVLFIPFHVIVDLKKDEEKISNDATVNWLMLSYNLIKPAENKTKKKKDKREKEKKAEKEPLISNIPDMIKTFKDIRKPVMRMVTDVSHIIQIKKLYCDITYGFPDPAETGIFYGLLCSAMGIVSEKCNNNCNYKCTINPVFTDNVLNYHITANIGFRLCLLIAAVLRFVANRKVLKIIWNILRKEHR
ncbi:MAG: DUF2953 domain-containing protein [Methanohalobium sp.]